MTAVILADRADVLPCTAAPDTFHVTSPSTIDGRWQIALALSACRSCPARAKCLADVETWEPKLRAGTVTGGVWWGRTGRIDSARKPTKENR